MFSFLCFFNSTATPEIYTLSLHDALPISVVGAAGLRGPARAQLRAAGLGGPRLSRWAGDRKSTRLNSSHTVISYAVFCLKKKTRDPQARPSPLHTHGPSSPGPCTRPPVWR